MYTIPFVFKSKNVCIETHREKLGNKQQTGIAFWTQERPGAHALPAEREVWWVQRCGLGDMFWKEYALSGFS